VVVAPSVLRIEPYLPGLVVKEAAPEVEPAE
jgi:hypothetical protein